MKLKNEVTQKTVSHLTFKLFLKLAFVAFLFKIRTHWKYQIFLTITKYYVELNYFPEKGYRKRIYFLLLES